MDAEARARACYEQNCQQMRSLNEIMWQVPMIAMTLTGGLWYAIATMGIIDTWMKVGLLIFGSIANIFLILMINRVRDVMAAYLNKMKEFHADGYADASNPDRPWWQYFMRDRGVCMTFSILMGIAAALSALGALFLALGVWPARPPCIPI